MFLKAQASVAWELPDGVAPNAAWIVGVGEHLKLWLGEEVWGPWLKHSLITLLLPLYNTNVGSLCCELRKILSGPWSRSASYTDPSTELFTSVPLTRITFSFIFICFVWSILISPVRLNSAKLQHTQEAEFLGSRNHRILTLEESSWN